MSAWWHPPSRGNSSTVVESNDVMLHAYSTQVQTVHLFLRNGSTNINSLTSPTPQVVTLAQGNKKEQITGFTQPLNFTLGSFTTAWPFFVLPHLSHNVILGTDFALRFRVTYDPYDWSLLILGDSEKLPTFLQSPLNRTPNTLEDLPTTFAALTLSPPKEPPEEQDRILRSLPFLAPFQELFYPKMGQAPQRPVDHEIILKEGARPKKISPYSLSDEKRQAMHEQVSDLFKQGAIEPSHSAWSSPLLFVKKKNNTWRMCVDFLSLNTETKADAYPLPRISNLLQKIGNATEFSKIDLASGFHQVPVQQKSREFTAFSTVSQYKDIVISNGESCHSA